MNPFTLFLAGILVACLIIIFFLDAKLTKVDRQLQMNVDFIIDKMVINRAGIERIESFLEIGSYINAGDTEPEKRKLTNAKELLKRIRKSKLSEDERN